MISDLVQDAINEQIQAEMYSSNLYLSMSAYCETLNLKGFAHWMRLQAEEERGHALKLVDYLSDRQGRVVIKALGEPVHDFASPLDVMEQTLAHEQKVTALINQLYETALAEKDYATQTMLQWYISEQVQEEAVATTYVEKLRMIGDKSNAIFWIDKELGKRV